MQADEGEFILTPSILDTPSLLTPNIVFTAPSNQSTYDPLHKNLSNNNENQSTSNPSSIATTNGTSSSTSSADVKVLKIEDELKQSLNETRRPTPSPFQSISTTNTFNFKKSAAVITTEDGTTIEIPSTADIVTELDALTNPLQFPIKSSTENNTRETTTTLMNGDNIRYDSPPTGSQGVIVSPPKKNFLIRSQSHTEPTSPIQNTNNNNNQSQSQKNTNDNNILNTQNGLDDDNSMDNSVNNQFTRVPALPLITHSNEPIQQFKTIIPNGNEQHLNIQIKPDQDGVQYAMLKQQQQQQQVVINTKRTFQQTNINNNMPSLTKANTLIIPQASTNEVTSTTKRQRTATLPQNTTVMNFHTSFPSTSSSVATIANALSPNDGNHGSDDHRKKQIRDSNREAARRCRERRRQYIEQLEGNLEHHKAQIKQLSEKLGRVERENTQLRAILSETKILHPSARLSINDSHIDYTNVINATGIDLKSELNHQTDGGTMQRNYSNRNNL